MCPTQDPTNASNFQSPRLQTAVVLSIPENLVARVCEFISQWQALPILALSLVQIHGWKYVDVERFCQGELTSDFVSPRPLSSSREPSP